MVTTETQIAVYAKLVNRPGELEHATRAIGDRNVNIDGISLETVGETGFVRFFTSRPKEVVDTLRSAGIECYPSESIVASLPNRPGSLAKATRELAAAGINVESVTGTPDGRLAFRTHDNELAEQILRKL